MQFLTESECTTWCQNHNLVLSKDLTARYGAVGECAFSVLYENNPSASVIALLSQLASPPTREKFQGGLLWMRAWGVWNELCERTAQSVVRQLRLANGDTSPLSERPGTLFGPNELTELHAFLTVPMLFGWDAYCFLEGQDYFLFISHDSWVDIHCKTRERFELEFRGAATWGPRVM